MVTYYLQKTLTKNGNSFGFIATNYQFDFDSAMTKVTENMEKSYRAKVFRDRARNSWELFSPHQLIIDTKDIRITFTLTGILTNDDGNLSGITDKDGGAVSATAVNKKNILIAMAEQGGVLTFFHRNFGINRPVDDNHPGNLSATGETVNIIKMQFDDEETEVTISTAEDVMKPGEVRLRFIIVLEKGIDR